MNYVYHNGNFEMFEAVKLPLSNRNFLYGDGLFESIRCMNGKPVFIQQHMERLQRGMKTLKLQMPWEVDAQMLSEKIIELNRLNKHTEGVRIRIVVGRNVGNTYKPDELSSSLFITSSPTPDNFYTWPAEGLTLGLFEDIKKPLSVFSDFKTCNSLLYVMASVYFSENKLDDCLLLNTNNNICEGSSSNVFWIKDKKLFTPSLNSGCINGVLRTVLVNQFNAAEKICTIEDILAADELFLTNMGTGIRWIRTFKNKTYSHTSTKSLFTELNNSIISGVLH